MIEKVISFIRALFLSDKINFRVTRFIVSLSNISSFLSQDAADVTDFRYAMPFLPPRDTSPQLLLSPDFLTSAEALMQMRQ